MIHFLTLIGGKKTSPAKVGPGVLDEARLSLGDVPLGVQTGLQALTADLRGVTTLSQV